MPMAETTWRHLPFATLLDSGRSATISTLTVFKWSSQASCLSRIWKSCPNLSCSCISVASNSQGGNFGAGLTETISREDEETSIAVGVISLSAKQPRIVFVGEQVTKPSSACPVGALEKLPSWSRALRICIYIYTNMFSGCEKGVVWCWYGLLWFWYDYGIL